MEAKEQKLTEVRKEIREKQDKSLQKARLEDENLRQAWMDQLTEDKAVFLLKLKGEITSQVMRIGEKVLRDLANEKLERQIITMFLKRFQRMIFFNLRLYQENCLFNPDSSLTTSSLNSYASSFLNIFKEFKLFSSR